MVGLLKRGQFLLPLGGLGGFARLGRKALEEVAQSVRPETILG